MRLLNYMEREGLRAIVTKFTDKLGAKLGGASSKTVFLCCDARKLSPPAASTEYLIRKIGESDIDEFRQFNFFPHINVEDYVPAGKDGAFGCFYQGQLIGYVCYESEKIKTIYGTGSFILSDGEAWIGPCYVDRVHRGKGLNTILVRRAALSLAKRGVRRLFTSINGSNDSSLASFRKIGFRKFAFYSERSGICISDVQDELFDSSVLEKKILINKIKKGN